MTETPAAAAVVDAPPSLRWKRRWLLRYWILQAVVLYVGWTFLMAAPEKIAEALSDPGYALGMGCVIALLCTLQAVFLLPVRPPGRARVGKSLWASASVAVFAGVLVAVAAGCAALSAAWIAGTVPKDVRIPGVEWILLGVLVLGWAVGTPLLVAFVRRRPTESALARVASRLFLGTGVEVAAVVPIDVMVRRKTDCYCGEGSFVSLTLLMAAGALMLGPAMFLVLLSRRRKRFRGGLCDACGAVVPSSPVPDRCPSCGAGWREG